MFSGTGEGLPTRIAPCIVPSNLRLQVHNLPGAATARARCGHDIAEEHALVIHTDDGSYAVKDRAAMLERNRDAHGRRPLGFLGRNFGRSIHACDNCRRTWSLGRTILCPCCGTSIPEKTRVMLVPRNSVQIDHMFDPFITGTVDGSEIVVCAECAATKRRGVHAAEDEAPREGGVHLWVDGRVVTYHEDDEFVS